MSDTMQLTTVEGVKCVWKDNEEFIETSCGNTFQFTYDGVKENKFKFCPYCGKPIEEDSK